jgi:hypothetical protein
MMNRVCKKIYGCSRHLPVNRGKQAAFYSYKYHGRFDAKDKGKMMPTERGKRYGILA